WRVNAAGPRAAFSRLCCPSQRGCSPYPPRLRLRLPGRRPLGWAGWRAAPPSLTPPGRFSPSSPAGGSWGLPATATAGPREERDLRAAAGGRGG
ncbi:unnamed protein product, partial [Bubo scandiacus]